MHLLVLLMSTSPPSAAETTWYGELTATTDYVFRGVSQTLSRPALQGEFGFEDDGGWYGFLWASNVDFTDGEQWEDGARVELNMSAGREVEISDRLTASVAAIRYLFPGTEPGIDYDYTEWLASLTFDERHGFLFGHSDNVFGSGATGRYYALTSGFELDCGLILSLRLGHYDLEDAYDSSYRLVEATLAGDWRLLNWQLSFVATDDGAAELFPESTVRNRVVLALSLAF
jgi:uncharacterized protein (TIGR02001 family)